MNVMQRDVLIESGSIKDAITELEQFIHTRLDRKYPYYYVTVAYPKRHAVTRRTYTIGQAISEAKRRSKAISGDCVNVELNGCMDPIACVYDGKIRVFNEYGLHHARDKYFDAQTGYAI